MEKEKRMTKKEWEYYFRDKKNIPEEIENKEERLYTEDEYLGLLQREKLYKGMKNTYNFINKQISEYNKGRKKYKEEKEKRLKV